MEIRDAKRGQASVEFLMVFAVSISILIVIFFLVSQQIVSTGVQKENAEAQKTVDDLSKAITDVYTQGEGASETVHISLPSTYDPAHSGIINNSILLRTRETSRVQNFPFPVYGTLPQAAGVYDVVIISRGNSVYVGSSLFRMSPALISVVVAAHSSQSRTVTITNLVNESITVNGSLAWPPSQVALSISDLNFELPPYGQQTVSLSFTSSGTSGSYPGSITFNASSSQINDSQALGLYAEVPSIIEVINATSSMSVYPLVWNTTVAKGNSTSAMFTICALNTPINSLSFLPSAGLPGAWVDDLAASSVSMNSCVQKTLVVTVPRGTRPGTYSGSIVLSGDSIYVNSIQLIVTVTT